MLIERTIGHKQIWYMFLGYGILDDSYFLFTYLYFIILYVRHISLLYQEKLKGYYKKLHSLYKRTQDLLLTSSDGRIKGLQILSSKNNTETGQNCQNDRFRALETD